MTTRIPVHTISEAQQAGRGNSRLAAILTSRRVRSQRSETFLHLLGTWGRRLPARPWDVTLTRIAPRALDDDNLQAALKAGRDGVADWLAGAYGQGQDRQAGLTWHYAQSRGQPHEYAVEVTITETSEMPLDLSMGRERRLPRFGAIPAVCAARINCLHRVQINY